MQQESLVNAMREKEDPPSASAQERERYEEEMRAELVRMRREIGEARGDVDKFDDVKTEGKMWKEDVFLSTIKNASDKWDALKDADEKLWQQRKTELENAMDAVRQLLETRP